MQNLIEHFDKTYTFKGFSVGLQIDESSESSRADIFIIRNGKLYECNFQRVELYTKDGYIDLESEYDEIEVMLRKDIKDNLKEWLYSNGY